MSEKPSQVTGTIVGHRTIAADHYCLTVSLSADFPTPTPGQFVMLREAGRSEPFLSRPLSVFAFSRYSDQTVLDLLYRVAGQGTALLSTLPVGHKLNLLGPLGKGFSVLPISKQIIFVAGGVGIAPLVYLLRTAFLSQSGFSPSRHFYLGARSANLLAGVEQLEGVCEIDLCTDDGSCGFRGPVTDLLERNLSMDVADEEIMIYACGPMPMLRALNRVLAGRSIPCQISLEERMACGLGACLGCAVETFSPSGERSYQRVCHDGPVFALREIFPTPLPGERGRPVP